MATQSDVRRIARALPGVAEVSGRFAFGVFNKDRVKGFAWVWNERVEPKKPKVPRKEVLAVRVANLAQKEAMLADTKRFFTEPHYNGYPAILVRLTEVSQAELRILLEEAWRTQAPKELTQPSATPPRKKVKRPASKRGKTKR